MWGEATECPPEVGSARTPPGAEECLAWCVPRSRWIDRFVGACRGCPYERAITARPGGSLRWRGVHNVSIRLFQSRKTCILPLAWIQPVAGSAPDTCSITSLNSSKDRKLWARSAWKSRFRQTLRPGSIAPPPVSQSPGLPPASLSQFSRFSCLSW